MCECVCVRASVCEFGLGGAIQRNVFLRVSALVSVVFSSVKDDVPRSSPASIQTGCPRSCRCLIYRCDETRGEIF